MIFYEMKWFFCNNSENKQFLHHFLGYIVNHDWNDTKLYHITKEKWWFKFMVTFGDSESFFGDGPIPEEADGWSTSRISWFVVVSILRGSFNLSSLVVDLERWKDFAAWNMYD